jgi:hypothetical protein
MSLGFNPNFSKVTRAASSVTPPKREIAITFPFQVGRSMNVFMHDKTVRDQLRLSRSEHRRRREDHPGEQQL